MISQLIASPKSHREQVWNSFSLSWLNSTSKCCTFAQTMRIWNPCSFNPPELCLISCCCLLALTWKSWLTFHTHQQEMWGSNIISRDSLWSTVIPWWDCSSDLALWFLNLPWTLEQTAYLKINITCCCASCNPQREALHPPPSQD